MIRNHDGVYIINNYLPPATCQTISKALNPLLNNSDRDPFVKAALGFANAMDAAKVSIENPIIPITNDQELNNVSALLTQTIMYVKSLLEDTYKEPLNLIQCIFNQLSAGGSNPVHVDDSTGMYSKLKYAALLYINQAGIDYQGGEIVFPEQSLTLKPESGTLIFFKGDDERPHGVQVVQKGIRENIIMFFTTKE